MRSQLAFAGVFLATQFAAAAPLGSETFTSASGITWEKHQFLDQVGEPETYFLVPGSHPEKLLVMLQGSGCVPVFASMGGRLNVATSDQDRLVRAVAGRTAVMIIEKPGIAFNSEVGAAPGSSDQCSTKFRTRYSLPDWGQTVERAIADYGRAIPGGLVKQGLVGISEGSETAAWLSGRGFRGPIATISGGCSGTLSGRIAQSLQRERDKQDGTPVDEALHTLDQINEHPDASDRYAWGQTFLRWSTFGAQCDLLVLNRYPDLVFVAYGTADPQVDMLGLESYARMRELTGLPVMLRRVRNGDHGLFVGENDELLPTLKSFVDLILSPAKP